MNDQGFHLAWEWLAAIAARDDTVRIYMDVHRKEYGLPYPDYRTVALSPTAMMGLVEVLVGSKDRIFHAYRKYLEVHCDIAMVMDKKGNISPLRPFRSEDREILEAMLANARKEIERLEAELARREKIWLGRLNEADARAESILRRTVNRFMDMPAATRRMTPAPDWTVVSVDESASMERALIATSANIYFKDFLRSWWKRHLQR